ncbi:hypothetical protein [uncultured Phascolarctobacterium sp.]|uniref:hypothetical protein n=1 Tax=uncultured Phascolarctobacterium sp. TaxID=512296 RepID=UPI0025EEBF80|nr:hypothetical protein [uncultured Phascolarctobacterium sp.]
MNKLEEFWYCVAPQEDLPLYKGQEISSGACTNLINFIELYKSLESQDTPENTIQKIILLNPDSISDIRVLVGVSDKRLYLDLTYLANIYTDSNNRRLVNEEREHLLKHNTTFFIRQLSLSPMKNILALEITKYFVARGLLDILNTFTSLTKEQIIPIFDNLIAPKEIQQMQAKYRGHGAEQAFAKVVTACGCPITPEHKDIDPMAGYDPNVDLDSMSVVTRDASNENCHSFDLIVNDASGNIRVLIQSLIHSSDPGQYGVNKSDETKDIYKRINLHNENKTDDRKVYLLGSVDGVGFSENPNGTIVKMIDAFDDFFQMHTLFKIPVFLQKIGMIDNVEGISFDKSYFEDKAISHFVNNYLAPIGIQNMTDANLEGKNTLQAGKAVVIFK